MKLFPSYSVYKNTASVLFETSAQNILGKCVCVCECVCVCVVCVCVDVSQPPSHVCVCAGGSGVVGVGGTRMRP